jgi:hypothetical protein
VPDVGMVPVSKLFRLCESLASICSATGDYTQEGLGQATKASAALLTVEETLQRGKAKSLATTANDCRRLQAMAASISF